MAQGSDRRAGREVVWRLHSADPARPGTSCRCGRPATVLVDVGGSEPEPWCGVVAGQGLVASPDVALQMAHGADARRRIAGAQ